jgi:hypothetical protein
MMMAQEFLLEPGEKVVVEVRKYWLMVLLDILPYAILAIAPILLPKLLAYFPNVPERLMTLVSDRESAGARLVYGMWWLFLWMGAFKEFTSYYLDAWFITSRRIVSIEQKGFFYRQVSSIFLSRVQDATTEIEGILETVLDYGDIEVQSAGAANHFLIKDIPDPKHLRDIILAEAHKIAPLSV